MCERTQAPIQVPNATTKHFHKTQALMGATRPASGIKAKAHRQVCKKLSVSLYLVYEHRIFSDARNEAAEKTDARRGC